MIPSWTYLIAFMSVQVVVVAILHITFIGILIKCYPEDKKVALTMKMILTVSTPCGYLLILWSVNKQKSINSVSNAQRHSAIILQALPISIYSFVVSFDRFFMIKIIDTEFYNGGTLLFVMLILFSGYIYDYYAAVPWMEAVSVIGFTGFAETFYIVILGPLAVSIISSWPVAAYMAAYTTSSILTYSDPRNPIALNIDRFETPYNVDMGRISGKKDLTDNDKRAIVVGRQNGLTMMTLAGMFGVTEAVISQFLKRQKAQDGSTNSQRTGRPRVTDRNDDRNILKTSRTNPRLTAPAIRREVFLNSPSPPSVSTVKRRLNAAGIMGRRPVKKPLISEKESSRQGEVGEGASQLDPSRLEQDSVVRRNQVPPLRK
ncbi:unnamed protein product [Caenorhabditis auriculariae]|uniref:Transposase Tc1-like domain-containing protein n=1 Tax=Caenorhabditis auriculariae TaxID=2777116 RepID=A0A8S1HRI6_9PELO|nr:unnamed protein product [Caenorhabditis auriculariae]